MNAIAQIAELRLDLAEGTQMPIAIRAPASPIEDEDSGLIGGECMQAHLRAVGLPECSVRCCGTDLDRIDLAGIGGRRGLCSNRQCKSSENNKAERFFKDWHAFGSTEAKRLKFKVECQGTCPQHATWVW